MALRVTREYVGVLGADDGKVRVTRQYVEVLTPGHTQARVARQYVEVLASLSTDVLCVTRQCVAILGNPPAATEHFVNAPDALVLNDVANCVRTYILSASDNLSLSDAVSRVHTVVAYDLIAVSDQALVVQVRVASDTIILNETATVEVTRAITDTLTLNENATRVIVRSLDVADTLTIQDGATYAADYYRKVYESIVLTDEAGRSISAFDTLTLSDSAVAERLTLVSDSLVLSDEATAFTIRPVSTEDSLTLGEMVVPGHVTQRTGADTLSLIETCVGDTCKVSSDALTLTDEATFVFTRLIADTLTLTDEASYTGVFQRRVWETIVLTEETHHDKELDAVATDTLSLVEVAGLIFEASDTLSLSDAATAVATRAAYDTLTVVDEAIAVRDRVLGHDALYLTEVADRVLDKGERARDILYLSERAWPGFQRLTATDVLQWSYSEYDPETLEETVVYVGLQDQATAFVVYAEPKTAEDHLSFAERAVGIRINANAIAVEAGDNLSLTEDVRVNVLSGAIDSLVLSDTAEVVASKLLADDLDLSDTATFNINRNSLSGSDAIQLSETVLWHYDRLGDFLNVYHPFVGEGTGTLPDPPDEELEGPIPGVVDSFKLVYPVTGPFSDTLVLRAPNLGNRDRLQMNRINRETRGGTLFVYADPIWPKVQTLVLNFSELTWGEARGLHTFMDDHLGLEVGMLDWEHRFWGGVITKLDDPIVQDGRGCQYSVGFEFEGEMMAYSP